MSSNKKNIGYRMSMTTTLFLIFLVLKLTNNIDWSWWWVTFPLIVSLIAALLLRIIKWD